MRTLNPVLCVDAQKREKKNPAGRAEGNEKGKKEKEEPRSSVLRDGWGGEEKGRARKRLECFYFR